MATVVFDVLYPRIRMHAKKISVPELVVAVRNAARKVCAESTMRRQAVQIDVELGNNYYTLVAANPDEEVIRIEAAQYTPPGSSCPQPLSPVSPEAASNYPQNNGPCYFWLVVPSEIFIGPTPQVDAPGALQVQCVYQPTLTAMTLDSGLVQQADRAIIAAALSDVLTQKDTTWYNPPLAQMFEQKYMAEIARVTNNAQTNYQPFNLTSAVYRY